MRIVAIVPARGGSKRIPGKNIRPLGGKPLIYYTLDAARKSAYINEIVVSTEDPKIKETVENYNRDVSAKIQIIDRPAALASDSATTEEALVDALRHLKADYVVLLPPTSPFRRAEDIDGTIRLVLDNKAKSGQSISQLKLRTGSFVDGVYTYDAESQVIEMGKLKRKFVENSAVYVFDPMVLLKTGRMQDKRNMGNLMEKPYDLDINDPWDWDYAEFLMGKMR